VLREGATLATGPEGEAFEKEFAAFVGSADACGQQLFVGARTDGHAVGAETRRRGDSAGAHVRGQRRAFARTGAAVRWADIDPDTRVISAESVRGLIAQDPVLWWCTSTACPPTWTRSWPWRPPRADRCRRLPPRRRARATRPVCGRLRVTLLFQFPYQKNISHAREADLTVRDRVLAVRPAAALDGQLAVRGHARDYWRPAMGNLVEPIPGRGR